MRLVHYALATIVATLVMVGTAQAAPPDPAWAHVRALQILMPPTAVGGQWVAPTCTRGPVTTDCPWADYTVKMTCTVYNDGTHVCSYILRRCPGLISFTSRAHVRVTENLHACPLTTVTRMNHDTDATVRAWRLAMLGQLGTTRMPRRFTRMPTAARH